jgi:hypothetical protein
VDRILDSLGPRIPAARVSGVVQVCVTSTQTERLGASQGDTVSKTVVS